MSDATTVRAGEQGIFDAKKHLLFVHAAGCQAINRANPRRGLHLVHAADLADAVEDMIERGDAEAIRSCKCRRGT